MTFCVEAFHPNANLSIAVDVDLSTNLAPQIQASPTVQRHKGKVPADLYFINSRGEITLVGDSTLLQEDEAIFCDQASAKLWLGMTLLFVCAVVSTLRIRRICCWFMCGGIFCLCDLWWLVM